MMMRHMIRRASSTVVTSRPITPLTISHLLDFESKVLSDTTMSHESLKYLCEQGAVRTYTHNEHHTHIHTHTQQVRVATALRTLNELPEPILKQCSTLTKHYQSCLDIISSDYDNENYKVVGSAVDKAARGMYLSSLVPSVVTHELTISSPHRHHTHDPLNNTGKRLGFDMMNIARAIRTHASKDTEYFGSSLQKETDGVVHRFNNTRIGIRLLNDMYARAVDPKSNNAFSAVGRGILHKRVNVNEEIERAASFVESIAVENLYMCPDIVIRHNDSSCTEMISYVPAHVWYIVVEILKNAVVAVVDNHASGGGASAARSRPVLPQVNVDILTSETSTAIDITDSGGGIKNFENAMAYCFTTGTRPAGNDLNGAGIGLPMAHAYAEYFGGSLGFQNTKDGCRVSVRLSHDPSCAEGVADVS